MNIYKSGIGDELVNPANFNFEIERFLKSEEKLIKSYSAGFSTVIEAGCMNGRNANLIYSLRKNYIGIDVESRYINEAKLSFKDYRNLTFVCDDIINLESILFESNTKNIFDLVVIFPFNSFGNITKSKVTLEKLLDQNFNLIISTYKTDDFSTLCRKDYYVNSGFCDLKVNRNKNRVRISNNSGLDSKAFSEYWFNDVSVKYGVNMKKLIFSKIGVAYMFGKF